MPGEMQLVEGKVVVEDIGCTDMFGQGAEDASYFDVEGLQEALEKWVGREVSITIEDVTK